MAKTVFFPEGPKSFDIGIPFAVHTLPETKNGLPVQIAILGIEGSSISVYDGNSQKEIKRLGADKVPEAIVEKAEGFRKIQDEYLTNIFPQGTLPDMINFIPGEA